LTLFQELIRCGVFKYLIPTLLFWLLTDAALAQSQPTVRITLSQPSAREGDRITAAVVIEDAEHVGGADVGIRVDDGCLRIVGRPLGDFLPSETADGGFVSFQEQRDHDARVVIGILDPTRLANGEGTLYEVELLVTCTSGVATIEIVTADLSSYPGGRVERANLVSHRVSEGNLTLVNAEVEILAQVTPTDEPTATFTSTPVPTATPTATPTVTVEPTVTPTGEPSPVPSGTPQQPAGEPGESVVPQAAVAIGCTALFLLAAGFWVMRRTLREAL
jgi:hypothetical protein